MAVSALLRGEGVPGGLTGEREGAQVLGPVLRGVEAVLGGCSEDMQALLQDMELQEEGVGKGRWVFGQGEAGRGCCQGRASTVHTNTVQLTQFTVHSCCSKNRLGCS